MFEYGKMSSCAVAAMSALAETHAGGGTLSSLQIAESRNLSQPLVAKVMTILSQHGFIHGTRGPGGGYRLASEPQNITLFDVVSLFENKQASSVCPFGPGWCGHGEPCPLHDALVEVKETSSNQLKSMHFGEFVDHPKASYKPTQT